MKPAAENLLFHIFLCKEGITQTGKDIKSDDRRESAISPEHLGMIVYHDVRAIICNPKFYIEKKVYRDYTEKRNRTGTWDEFTWILTDNHQLDHLTPFLVGVR